MSLLNQQTESQTRGGGERRYYSSSKFRVDRGGGVAQTEVGGGGRGVRRQEGEFR